MMDILCIGKVSKIYLGPSPAFNTNALIDKYIYSYVTYSYGSAEQSVPTSTWASSVDLSSIQKIQNESNNAAAGHTDKSNFIRFCVGDRKERKYFAILHHETRK